MLTGFKSDDARLEPGVLLFRALFTTPCSCYAHRILYRALMKKAKPKNATSRMISAATVEEYFDKIPEPQLSLLQKVRATIRKAAPAEAVETISYGMPAFKYNGALVCYAAFSDQCSLFPMGREAIDEFKPELRGFETAKGTIRFTVEKPLPASLITKIVKFRVARNEGKAKLKAGAKKRG